jgi:hypothetical protein
MPGLDLRRMPAFIADWPGFASIPLKNVIQSVELGNIAWEALELRT